MASMENPFRDRIKALKMVPIDDVVDFAAGNPVDRTEQDIAVLDASLIANGYAMPVEVWERPDGKYETIDGHGRVDRIRVLWPEVREIKVIVLDVDSVADGRKLLLGFRNNARWSLDDLDKWVADALERNELGVDEVMNLSGLTAADLDSLAQASEDLLDALPSGPPQLPADPSPASETPRQLSSAERAAQIFVFSKEMIAESAFQHYRAKGFPFPDPSAAECMLSINRLASMSMDQLIRSNEGIHAADKFQPHRWSAVADKMISPMTCFGDDKKLKYVIDMTVDAKGTIGDMVLRSMIGMFQGAQVCSNFRPGFAAYLYRRFCKPGGTVLDMSAGYGGRLVGALASTVVGKYIGIDPNSPSIDGSRKLLKLLGREDFARFFVEPAEDVDVDEIRGSCAFAFTSPPYFNKEIYSDAPTQSGNRFPDIDSWRAGFLVPMLRMTYAALEPGAHCGINIADVLVGGIRHPLAEFTIVAAKSAGFEHVGTLDFPLNGSRFAGKTDDSFEPVVMFRKDPKAERQDPAPAKKKKRR